MSSPLKNASVADIERTIAEALQKLSSEDVELSVDIGEMKFNAASGSVSMSFTAWKKMEPFEAVFGEM